MNPVKKPFSILIAEDDEDDFLFITQALEEVGVKNKMEWVRNGEDLLTFLQKSYMEREGNSVKPGLIFLDLNMPLMDGREALKEIKTNVLFSGIPVIILTTSQNEADVQDTYRIGANSYVQKPRRFQDFVGAIEVVSKYWLDTVKLPV